MDDRITAIPEVCGGEACIVGTRIPVWTLVRLQRLGMSDSEILASYPSLRADDVVHAFNYAALHPMEIDNQIRDHEAN